LGAAGQGAKIARAAPQDCALVRCYERGWEHRMRYEGTIYRPPSEAESYILQATIGCSWNKCVYCDMYRQKTFRIRELRETLADLRMAAEQAGNEITKLFVADGDALVLTLAAWVPILEQARAQLPRLQQVSCYATATNILEKSEAELDTLRRLGLSLLYIGPESGDDPTLKRIAKGSTRAQHVEAARKAHAAGMRISVIAMLGIGGVERSHQHAQATADLVTEMDPEYFAALTTSVAPGTPLVKLRKKGFWELPSVPRMLAELRTIVDRARPRDAVFRTNHASNYLAIGGRLPRDREAIVHALDAALSGKLALRPERVRGL
jgi:radical SAM superfamily enzyme YgiQ (UPF0313 family)